VIFGGFSADAVAERNNDAQRQAGHHRRRRLAAASGAAEQNVDAALTKSPTSKKCIVYKPLQPTRGDEAGPRRVWHELMPARAPIAPPRPLDSEHPPFILYYQRKHREAQGRSPHQCRYLLGVSTSHRWVFDLKEDDTYWCTADIGWITGHSYMVCGPLCNGATVVLYEGAPDTPQKDRFWSIIEK